MADNQNTAKLQNRISLFLIITLVVVAVVVQAQNMFQFPYFQDLEGTNLSNAWALIETGELSPYTYVYEEPPVGSFIISLWVAVTGGFNAFGFSLYSGRVLMLLAHLVTTALIFGITRKISKNDIAAALATLIFIFSPLSSSLQRLVLLDNLMVTFLLLSFYMVLGEHRRLGHYLASAILLGMAVLTKGSAIGFIPAFIIINRMVADERHRRFVAAQWITVVVFLISLYPMYAQMNLELFPQGTALGGDFPHVSLLERITDRGLDNGAFLNIGSGFDTSFNLWVDISTSNTADPLLVYAGIISGLFLVVLSIDSKQHRALLVMLVMFGLILLFGGQIFSTDIIMGLPLLAISIGVVVGAFIRLLAGNMKGIFRFALGTVLIAVVAYPFAIFYMERTDAHDLNQVAGQIEAIDWIVNTVPEDAVIVTDNFAFVELRDTHPNTQHYWRVDTDPEIQYNLLDDDYCNVDYMILTPQVFADINAYGLDLNQRIFNNSERLLEYSNGGWPVEIRQINKAFCGVEVAAETLVSE
ncbi:MAG: phospholipid carrier-dependent glycosyltransferase [Chloroflexi bacterium]|nr:phospholipid carrier-dependent glycosyltransferase [Chloroflexota bacterium]